VAESDGLQPCSESAERLATGGSKWCLSSGCQAEKATFGSAWLELLPKQLPKGISASDGVVGMSTTRGSGESGRS